MKALMVFNCLVNCGYALFSILRKLNGIFKCSFLRECHLLLCFTDVLAQSIFIYCFSFLRGNFSRWKIYGSRPCFVFGIFKVTWNSRLLDTSSTFYKTEVHMLTMIRKKTAHKPFIISRHNPKLIANDDES